MAKVIIDESLCTGCQVCTQSHPEVFKMNDTQDKAVVIAPDKVDEGRQAADECPVGAIQIQED